MITSDDNVSLSLQLSLVLLFFYMDLLHRYISYLERFLIKEDADRCCFRNKTDRHHETDLSGSF